MGENFEKTFATKIGKCTKFSSCMNKIKDTLNVTMKKKKRIILGQKDNENILAVEWMNQEIIVNINYRTELNKQWRYARKNGESREIIEEYKRKYITQQKKTSRMIGIANSNWEEKKIEETWRDGKKFWVMIAELLGKTKKREEAAYIYIYIYIYTEDGIKKEIMTH